jgi:putative ABC transport system permease protein
MRKRAFYKDIVRTLKNNLSRFFAITVMASLGIGVFSGFAVGCIDAIESADRFYHKQNTYDIQIVSTLGLTDDDLSAVSGVNGVREVFGSCNMDV